MARLEGVEGQARRASSPFHHSPGRAISGSWSGVTNCGVFDFSPDCSFHIASPLIHSNQDSALIRQFVGERVSRAMSFFAEMEAITGGGGPGRPRMPRGQMQLQGRGESWGHRNSHMHNACRCIDAGRRPTASPTRPAHSPNCCWQWASCFESSGSIRVCRCSRLRGRVSLELVMRLTATSQHLDSSLANLSQNGLALPLKRGGPVSRLRRPTLSTARRLLRPLLRLLQQPAACCVEPLRCCGPVLRRRHPQPLHALRHHASGGEVGGMRLAGSGGRLRIRLGRRSCLGIERWWCRRAPQPPDVPPQSCHPQVPPRCSTSPSTAAPSRRWLPQTGPPCG